MRRIWTAALFGLCASLLAGCFASDTALIDDATSTTPLKPGNYTATSSKPGESEAPTKVKITTDGNLTVFTSLDDKDSDAPTKVFFRKVRGDYYAMLESKADDKSYVYMLAEIDNGGMKMFDFTDACKTLEGVAAASHADITSLGVARVEKGAELDTCYFKSFDDLAKGFRAIIDKGPMEPVTILTPGT